TCPRPGGCGANCPATPAHPRRCGPPGWPCCGPPTTRWPPRRAGSGGATRSGAAGERGGGRGVSGGRLAGRRGGGGGVPRGRGGGLAGPDQVMLAGTGGYGGGSPTGTHIDAVVAEAAAPSSSLVLSRHGRLVVIVGSTGGDEADRVARALDRALGHRAGSGPADASEPGAEGPPPWRIAIGRYYPGPSGVGRSYDGAADAFDVAQRLGLPDPVVRAADLLIYQVLLRDRAAITDLVRTLLTPLARARGGAGPLLATLAAYYARGGVAAAAARDLHVSVRTVTYRRARVRKLTGRDPARSPDALALQVAVIGARMLDWPATRLERE